MYTVPVLDNQPSKPATLHLSQVVNRVSRCNHVLRRFVREAQKYSPKPDEIRPIAKPFSSLQSHESIFIKLTKKFKFCFFSKEGRRRLFVDSPKQNLSNSKSQPPITPRKASGVIKQLFSSPSSSLKRTLPSPNHSTTNTDKRQRLF